MGDGFQLEKLKQPQNQLEFWVSRMGFAWANICQQLFAINGCLRTSLGLFGS